MPVALALIATALLGLFPKQAQDFIARARKAAGAIFGPPAPAAVKWTAALVLNTAQQFRQRYGLNIDPVMIAAMVQIESTYNPAASRYEKHIDDTSYGLMQVLLKTAQWLYDDLGYRAFPRPTATNMMDGYTSIYYGAAYVDYLSKYRGKRRNEQWIVESYNGGPANSNADTQRHYAKYMAAKAQIIGSV